MKYPSWLAQLCSLILFLILINSGFSAAQAAERIRIGIIPLSYGESNDLKIYADGTQDTLINALQTIPDLVVIDRSRTSAVLKEIAFQQTAMADSSTQSKMGKILGVNYLYTGSIQKAGNQVRIQIQELNVETNEIRALGKVTGELEQLFNLQDQLAEQIVMAHQIKLSPAQKQALSGHVKVTENLAAYESNVKGTQVFESGQKDLALQYFTQAIKADPMFKGAYMNRAIVYKDQQKYSLALADYNKALALDPQFALAYYNRGALYSAQQDYNTAIDDYSQAIRIDPNYIAAYINRAIIYLNLEAYNQALNDLNQALQLAPPTYPYLSYLYLNRAATYQGLKQYQRAIADSNKAIQLDSSMPEAYRNRADAYFALKDYAQALADYNKELSISPSANAYAMRGTCYHNLKNDQLAIEDYTKAILLEPTNGRFYLNRGISYENQNKCAQALADYKKACSLGKSQACSWGCKK